MADPFIGEIRAVAFTFAPQGWMNCNGQTLSIAQNTALFSILGTNYGGDGTTTFGLPNLNSQALVGTGQGTGLSSYTTGQVAGVTSVTLDTSQMPQHIHAPGAAIDADNTQMHTVPVTGDQLTRYAPAGAIGQAWNTPPFDNPVAMATQMVQQTGNSLPHDNMQPFLTLRYIIAIDGIFPSRN